jgi:uncharacterized OB-fold protein
MDLAIKQLSRTPLGHAATQQAINLAGQNTGGDASGKWLMQGVIFQQCGKCTAVCYPPRPLCPECLSEQLQWRQNAGGGRVLSTTCLHVSLNKFYRLADREAEPWVIGMVAHDDGPVLYVFLDKSVMVVGSRVALFTAPDIIGESVIIGVSEDTLAIQSAGSIAAKLGPTS